MSSTKYKRFNPLKNKVVYISLNTRALGDTLAWFPYIEEFRLKHGCFVRCLFKNSEFIDLFKNNYPSIEFLGKEYIGGNKKEKLDYFKLPLEAHNSIAYNVGFNWNDVRKQIPLQKVASDTLGLIYKERRPKIVYDKLPPPVDGKYVCIAVHSTGGQLKYWNYPSGWEIVVRHLRHKGYKVLVIDLNEEQNYDGYENIIPSNAMNRTGRIPLKVRASDLHNCSFFIGTGSGLAWLAWAVGKPVIMVHGMTEDWYEFQNKCVHVQNKEVCHGCWHNHKLDLRDWSACPEHRATERMFECTKMITPPMVFKAINKVENEYL